MANYTPLVIKVANTSRSKKSKRGKGFLFFASAVFATLGAALGLLAFLLAQNGELLGTYSASVQKGADPVIYWKFDGARASAVEDSSPNDNDAVQTNASWEYDNSCVFYNCLNFNGTNSLVSRAYSSDTELDTGTGTFTVSTWFKHYNAMSGTDILVSRYNNGGFKIYMNSSGQMCFGIDSDSAWGGSQFDEACTTGTYNDSRWHHLIAIKNSSSIELYINDTLVAEDTSLSATGSLSGSSPTFYIGVDSNGASNYWAGYVDEFRFYNYARNLTQRKLDFIGIGAANAQPAAAGAYARKYLSDGLVGRWRMDERAADTCVGGVNDSCDSSGNANDGAWFGNAVQNSNGRFDFSVAFDGAGDYVSIANNSSISPTNALTLSVWVFPTAVNSRAILVKNNSYRIVTNAGGFPICQFYKDGNWQTGAVSSQALSANIWSQIVCTFDGVQVVTFLNSVRTADANLLAPINASTNALEFGRDAGGTFTDFAGRMDEVRIWNKALTEREARDIYQWAPGPVAYWKLDENEGTVFYDSSGNDLTGNFAASPNDPVFVSGRYASGMEFDGNDQASVAHNSQLTLNAWSIGAWVRPDFFDGSYQTILYKGIDTSTNYFINIRNVSSDVNRFTCGFFSNSTLVEQTAPLTLGEGRWYHVMCTYNISSRQMQIFINGRRYLNSTIPSESSTPNYNSNPLFFGYAPNYGDYLRGVIDHIVVYNYVRTQEQIYEDMWGGYRPTSSTRMPIGYWKFEEYRGNVANNSGTEIDDYNGSLEGFPNLNSTPPTATSGWTYYGKVGRALMFDGDNDRVNVGSDEIIDNMPVFSITAWINPQGWGELNLGNIISKGSVFKFRLRNNSGQQTLEFSRSRATTATTAYAANGDIQLNRWTHVAVVYDVSNYVKLYINGQEAIYTTRTLGSGSISSASSSDGGSSMHIGGMGGNESFQGIIDEVKVYNIALNDDEVVQDYRQGAAVQVGNKGEVDITPFPSLTPQAQIGDSSEYYEYCVPGDLSPCSPPLHEWKIERIPSPTPVRDSGVTSGSFRHLSLTGTPRFTTGFKGVAIDFRNNLNAIANANLPDLTAGTLSLWIMPSSTINSSLSQSTGFYGTYSNATNNSQIGFRGTDFSGGTGSAGALIFARERSDANNYVASQTTTWLADEWYYITLTWGSGNWQLYANGIREGTGSFSSAMLDIAADIFGRTQWDSENVSGAPIRHFDGIMDQIVLYNYIRTPAQINWEMNRGSPMLWWRLDDCSGTTARDSSPLMPRTNGVITIGGSGSQTSAGTCSSSGSTAWNNGTNGKFVSSLSLDGTDDFIQSTSTDTTFKQPAFSVSFWVNPTTTQGYMVSKYGSGCNQAQFQIYQEAGNLLFTVPNTGGTCDAASTSYTALPTNQWSHVVGTFDGINARLYVDNRLRSTSAAYSGTFNTTNGGNLNVSIQGERPVGRMGGRYDDIQLFPYPLTEAQVRVLYNDGAALRYAPVTGVP